MHLRIFKTFKDDDAPLYHLRRTDLETPSITWPPPLTENEPVRVTVLDGGEQGRVWNFVHTLYVRETTHASHPA